MVSRYNNLDMKPKLLLSLSIFLFSLFSFSSPVQAAIQDQGTMKDMLDGGVIFLSGCVSAEDQDTSKPEKIGWECPTKEGREMWMYGGKESNRGTGALGIVNRSVAYLYTPPASSVEYVADLMNNSVFGNNQAYAQGVGLGFASLSPVLGIWKIFRNISYFFFVIAFMIVGFAIMFRAKINPQTVVNIQMALPQLVVTLVLISFSYAIAGLLIDVMFITTQMITGIAANSILVNANPADIQRVAFEKSFIANTLSFFAGDAGQFKSIGVIAGEGLSEMVYDMLGGGQGNALTDLLGGAASLAAGSLFALIILGTMLWNGFKILFSLLTSYVMIILLVITAPLRLLMNVYPGSNAFMSWLKELAGHLAVFPVVVGMIFFMYALMGINTGPNIGYNSENPGFSPPQTGFSATGAVQGLIGIGVLLAIPGIIDQTKEFFGVKAGQGGADMLGAGLMGALARTGQTMAAPGMAAGRMGLGMYRGAMLGSISEGFSTGGVGGAVQGFARGLDPRTLYREQQEAAARRRDVREATEASYLNESYTPKTSKYPKRNLPKTNIPESDKGAKDDPKAGDY